jgi:hypothetical protein
MAFSTRLAWFNQDEYVALSARFLLQCVLRPARKNGEKPLHGFDALVTGWKFFELHGTMSNRCVKYDSEAEAEAEADAEADAAAAASVAESAIEKSSKSDGDAAVAKAAEKKAELEKLQLKVAQNQRTYLEPFPLLTTSEASTPSLIPDPKSGVSLNTSTETINSSQSASVKIPARNLSLSRVVMDEMKSRVRIGVLWTGYGS